MKTSRHSIANNRHSRTGGNSAIQLCLWALVLFTSYTGMANASELGRLFYTPQEREQLETQLANGQTTDGIKRNFIVVNGVIQKQGGNRIVWLNGQAQTPARGNNNPASIDVTVPGKSKHVQVKVGQRLMLDTATTTDVNSNSTAANNEDD